MIKTIGNATLYLGDCRDVMKDLPKVDAIICDLPYGTTRCAWDSIIPFDELWQAIATVSGKGTPIVLFGTEPFSSMLRLSNLKQFKYDWIWSKPKATGFLNAKIQPMRAHEIVSVFCDGSAKYNPVMTTGHERKKSFRASHLQTDVYGKMSGDYLYDSTERYPRSVQEFLSDTQNSSEHSTQKPVALMRYLIKTHSDPADTVLDFTMGSGTTGVACALEGRKFIGIEQDAGFFETAVRRISDACLDIEAIGAAA